MTRTLAINDERYWYKKMAGKRAVFTPFLFLYGRNSLKVGVLTTLNCSEQNRAA
jgi:hypothetical protein